MATFDYNQEEILRFTLHRPPTHPPTPILGPISIKNDSDLQRRIIEAWRGLDPDTALANINTSNDPEMLWAFSGLVYEVNYQRILERIKITNWPPSDELVGFGGVIYDESGGPVEHWLASPDLRSDQTKLENAILFSIVYAPFRQSHSIADYLLILRLVNAVRLLKKPIPKPLENEFSSQNHYTRNVLLARIILIPEELGFKGVKATPPNAAPQLHTGPDRKQLIELRDHLANASPDDFYSPDDPEAPWLQVFGSIRRTYLSDDQHVLLIDLKQDFKRSPVQHLINAIDVWLSSNPDVADAPASKLAYSGETIVHSRSMGNAITQSGQRTPGRIRSVGIADLLVVQQHIKSYSHGEVAHIENAFAGESRSRLHIRKETTEIETTIEEESITEEERSTQTTDRMEIKREVNTLLKEEESIKAGASLSASYGPSVEFKTYVDGATSSSLEEAKRQGTTYSREIVQRAVTKVSERILEKRRTRRLTEVTDSNTYEIDNKENDQNRSAIYQWVDKIYQSQVYNYGKRVLYDILVPEPAASFIFALQKGADERPLDLVKPEPFTVKPTSLTPANYDGYVVQYLVTDATPPPEPFKSVVHTFPDSQAAINQAKSYAHSLPIPENYEAMWGRVSVTCAVWTAAPNLGIDVIFGTSSWRRTKDGSWTNVLNLEYRTGGINLLATAVNTPTYSIGFDAMCRLSPGGLSKWQNKIHSEILTAYAQRLAEYENKLDQYSNAAMSVLYGRSADENRTIERVEIKKAVTRLFYGQELDFGSIVHSGNNAFPGIDEALLSEQARTIRFFEQAFEWDQMQYRFYPYYWGGRDSWLGKILNRDPDSLFRDFLRSGAARVVLSVRPGFEELVAHYFLTGEVWNGGELPGIMDPAYVPILQEIKESQQQTEATIYGEKWTFTVPTTLSIIRKPDTLPVWEQDANGDWQPKDDLVDATIEEETEE